MWSNQKMYANDLIALFLRSFKEGLQFGLPGAKEVTAMLKDGHFCLWRVTLVLNLQLSTFQCKGIRKGQKTFCQTWPNSHMLKKEKGPEQSLQPR